MFSISTVFFQRYYFDVYRLPNVCNIGAQRVSGQAYAQKGSVASVADGSESYWGNREEQGKQNPKQHRERRERERKILLIDEILLPPTPLP